MLACNREQILDRIVADLHEHQIRKNRLLEDINHCFSIDLIDKDHIHFRAERSKAVLHFIVRGLLRINLKCVETLVKYYGGDETTKLAKLIQAASTTSVFDEYPPDITSKSHPCFNKSTQEGKHAFHLYLALEALRRSVRRKVNLKMKMTANKESSSSLSSSNQPPSILGKRSSSPMDLQRSSSPIELLINATASLKKIGHDPSVKEDATRDLREELNEALEIPRGSTNVC